MKTTDGGLSWQKQNSNTESTLRSIFFINKSRGFVTGFDNTFLQTSNGGNNWRQIYIYSGDTKHNSDIYFFDNKNGWFINNYGEIYNTADSGDTWEKLAVLPDLGWSYIQFVDNAVGYSSRYYGSLLMRTKDGGQNWESIKLSMPNATMDIMVKDLFFVNKNTGFYAFSWLSGGHLETATPIMKTTDGGFTWTFQDSIMSPYLNCLHFIDENNGWIAGDNIYSTTDGGQSWQCCTNFDNSDVIVNLFFYDNNNAWALGINGSVYKYGHK